MARLKEGTTIGGRVVMEEIDNVDNKVSILNGEGDIKEKINIEDIIDNLASTSIDKPLSANQGREISNKIENLTEDFDEHKEDYVQHLNSEMPHQIKDLDTGKVYQFGLQIQNGCTQIIYEEVVIDV